MTVPNNEHTPNPGQGFGALSSADSTNHDTAHRHPLVVPPDRAPGTISQQHVDALTWASWGFRLFPLHPVQKVPRIKGWPKRATSDTAMIDTWWTRWPDSNIGCVPFAGHIVIDIDRGSGGFTTWEKIRAGREIPSTLINRTGGGGLHIWFKLPKTAPVHGKIPPGIDLQSERRQVVMPGSVHVRTGRLYRVEKWAGVAMLPEWLEEHIYKPPAPRFAYKPPKGKMPGAEGLIRHMATTGESARNNTLYSVARRLLEEGQPPAVLDELAAAALSTGLEEAEVQQTIRSAEQGARERRGAA